METNTSLLEEFSNNFKLMVGNGKRIKLWSDAEVWFDEGMLKGRLVLFIT